MAIPTLHCGGFRLKYRDRSFPLAESSGLFTVIRYLVRELSSLAPRAWHYGVIAGRLLTANLAWETGLEVSEVMRAIDMGLVYNTSHRPQYQSTASNANLRTCENLVGAWETSF